MVAQPAINNSPPSGVIGPITINQLQPSNSRQANKYNDPEKNIIPKVKR